MKTLMSICLILSFISGTIFGDTFGTGDNQFEIDFVPVSSSTNPDSGFGTVNYDYRMGIYEITNDQWDKFKNEYGTVYGDPTTAYDSEPGWTGINVPTNNVSWYEAAQFVNWLNITSNHTPAYKFTGTQGTGDYTFAVWDVIDAGYDASNPYRNSNAFYFLPTQDEWVKAAYWNGTTKQAYATIDNAAPVAGVDTNYDNPTGQPWDVGSGSEELNGTYDMMGNVMEWMESPYNSGEYLYNAIRPLRGGAYYLDDSVLKWSKWYGNDPDWESSSWGFRVASVIPEPCTLLLLGLGGLIVCRRERR